MNDNLLKDCVLNDTLNLLQDLYLDYKRGEVNIQALARGIGFLRTTLLTIEFKVQDYVIEDKVEINCLNNRVLNIANSYLAEFSEQEQVAEINICSKILGSKSRIKFHGMLINNLLERF